MSWTTEPNEFGNLIYFNDFSIEWRKRKWGEERLFTESQ